MSIFLRRYVFATILLPLSAPYANEAVQTDWSGNSGVWGPVIEFGTDFSFDTGTNPTGFPGDLVLQLVPYIVRHDITDEFMNAHEVAAGDLDGDGDLDVAGASYSMDDIAWWENLDGIGNYWEYHFVSPCGHAECVQIHDLDGDGDEDLIGGGDGVYWWENLDGTGMSWEQHLIDSTFNFIQGVCVVDLDGDNDIDVVGGRLADSPDPYLFWWENLDDKGGSWLRHVVNSDGDSHTVQVIDMDFDGDWDLLTAGGGRVEWWENLNASGYWLGHSIAHFPGVHGVCSADLDGDGDLDVAACSDISGITDDVSWWENLDGEGTAWSKHVIDGSAWGAMDLCAVDLDEDGDMDILGAVYYQFEKDVTWWEILTDRGFHGVQGLSTAVWTVPIQSPRRSLMKSAPRMLSPQALTARSHGGMCFAIRRRDYWNPAFLTRNAALCGTASIGPVKSPRAHRCISRCGPRLIPTRWRL